MLKISDILCGTEPKGNGDCEVVVSGDTPVEEVLQEMEEHGCERVGVDGVEEGVILLSKEEVLHGLLRELDTTEEKLGELRHQVEAGLVDQLDLMQQEFGSAGGNDKDKLELAIESMTEGLIIIDEQGEVEKSNPAARTLLGLGTDANVEVLKKAMDELGFRELVTGNGNGEAKSSGEFKVKASGGSILKMRWKEMVDRSEHKLGSVVTIRDVTEERAADRAKTEFIAAVSHELRTPLTSLQSSVSNMLAGVTGKLNKKARQYLYAMKADCHRFADHIGDLLDMAKLEAGSMPLNRRVINMVSVVGDAMNEFAPEANNKDIELTSEVSREMSPVYADPQRIYQVLWNLVNNALKFTEPGGNIRVRSYDSGSDVVTVVEDTGVGISESLQQEVFNKFYQIRRQAGPGSKGSGLGLAICNGIVSIHGGSIWLESRQGGGCKFYFSLPKTDPFIVLYKHLDALAKRTEEMGSEFELVIVNFDVLNEKREELKPVVGSLIKEILIESNHMMPGEDDLAIQTEDFEVVFVLKGADSCTAEDIKHKVQKMIENRLSKKYGKADILPMLGIAVYPGDSNDVRELEKIARRQSGKMY